MTFALTIVEGPGLGQRFAVHGKTVSIGRDEQSDVCLPVAGVSRTHATIRRSRWAWFLHDEGSTNGIAVNGRRASRPERLRGGDRICVASVVLQVERTRARRLLWLAVPAVACAAAAAMSSRHRAAPTSAPVTVEQAASVPDVDKARAAFERGQRKLEERRIAPRNLFDAWVAFTVARDKLEALPAKPAPYAAAVRLANETEADLRRDCQRLLFQAARFERYGEGREALQTYREVLLHFPGEDPAGCRKKAQDWLTEESGS
ncbi:MAG TPA: FHA domain-containing protein [Myxococcales bacterium]|jgi:hypothetical protein